MKKKLITLLVAILTVIPFVLITPKADTIYGNTETVNYSGSQIGTLQKSYSTSISATPTGFTLDIEGVPVPIAIPKINSVMQLTFNFYQYRSFEIVFTFGSIFTSDCYFVVGGGTIVSYNSTNKKLTVRGNGTDTLTLCLIYPTGGPASNNITYPSYSFNYVEANGDPEVNISYCEGHLRTLELNLSGLISYNSQTGVYSGYIVDIANDVDTLVSTVSDINDALEDLHNELEKLYIASMYNIEPYQHSAWFWCSKFDSSFPRWKYGLPYMQYNSSWNSGTQTPSKSFRLAQGYSYIMVFYSSKAITVNDITLYYSASTGNVSITSLPITEITAQLYLQAFIFKNENLGFSTFEPEINQTFELYPLYFGLTNNIPDDINMLLGREYDNTYTRLLQQIVNGVGGTSYDTSQYEQYEQSIDNLNDNMRDRFNNSETSFQNQLNDIFVPDNEQVGGDSNTLFQQFHFNTINSLFTGFLGDIFEIAPALKYIMLFGLLLLVLGVLI